MKPFPSSIFVYGTLKPGLRYHYLAQKAGAFEKEEAYLEGFGLYHLEPENYPALVRGEGRVHGWRYTYADISKALKVLDHLEGLHLEPPEYERVVAVAQPSKKKAWVYLYVGRERLEQATATLVSTGIWKPSKVDVQIVPRSLK